MKASLGHVRTTLRRSSIGEPLAAARRKLLGTTAPVRNRLIGARVRVLGGGNRLTYARVRDLHRLTITITGCGNTISIAPESCVDGLTIQIRGDDNTVAIGPSRIEDTNVAVTGDRNRVTIAKNCRILRLGAVCEDSGNSISVGAGSEFAGSVELAAMEGTAITVGENCLFSGGIHMRTGDSHAITDLNGVRINPSRSITIGEHVWVGMNVLVLKGANVPPACVVGACAVVTKRFEGMHCAIAGNPARVVREDLDWRVER
ncbi:MAG: acyltransferase [Thermoleophilia bacterium]